MAVAMLFAISLFFVGGTYARYVSTFDGTAKVGIAKWAVKLGEGDSEALDLTLTPEATTGYVVDGKIAPSYSANGTAEIDLEGTEVAVGIIAEVDQTKIAAKLKELGFDTNASDIQTKVTVEKGDGAGEFTVGGGDGSQASPYTITLPGNAAFASGDKVKVTVKVTWSNADDEHNEEHTKVGEGATADKQLEVPVTLHVFQYIQSESYTPAGA